MTDDLVIDALNKVLIDRWLNKDGIFHSDRGNQYASNEKYNNYSTSLVFKLFKKMCLKNLT